MDQTSKSTTRIKPTHYDANYGNFQTDLYEQIRREAFGEDIGQNSWLTAAEHNKFLSWLNLGPGKRLLDVACGAGGPALRLAALTGCSLVGVDIHERAITIANTLAVERGLAERAEFHVVDAGQQLPYPDHGFDAVTCIDAINHFPERQQILAEWARLLHPGGRLLFTDPIVVTGPLTNAEIAIRSSAGFYLFVPPEYDERILSQCGMRVLMSENRTQGVAEVAERRRAARASHEPDLRNIEGDSAYESQQEYLAVTTRIARERRLSRFVYVAEKAA